MKWLGIASGLPFMVIAGTFIGAIIAREYFGDSHESTGAIFGALIAFLMTLLEMYGLFRSEQKR